MRKYLLPSLIVLALSGALAVAQTITRAIQLSQDTTGAFSVDTNSGVYFPGHVLSSRGGAVNIPAATVSGNNTPTLVGSDTMGTVTFGSGSTTATVAFGQSYVTVPSCVVSLQQGKTASAISYVPATGNLALTITSNGTPFAAANYMCMSQS